MELLLWLERLYLWKIEREKPKQEQEQSESEEPSEVSYPPVLAAS